MAAPIPTGTVITYQSSDWHTEGYFTSPDDVLHAVETALAADGLTTRSGSTDVGALASLEGVATGDIPFSVTLQVQVTGGLGYASADDVAAIVNHEVYQATGFLPTAYSIPSVVLPVPGTSGQPQATVACGGGLIESIKGFFGNCTKVEAPGTQGGLLNSLGLGSLGSSAALWLGLFVLGFVGALALIGYSGALKRQ